MLITVTKYNYGKRHGNERTLKSKTSIQRLAPRHASMDDVVGQSINYIIENNNIDSSYDTVEQNELGYIYKLDGRVVLTANVVPFDNSLVYHDDLDLSQGWKTLSEY